MTGVKISRLVFRYFSSSYILKQRHSCLKSCRIASVWCVKGRGQDSQWSLKYSHEVKFLILVLLKHTIFGFLAYVDPIIYSLIFPNLSCISPQNIQSGHNTVSILWTVSRYQKRVYVSKVWILYAIIAARNVEFFKKCCR